LCECAFMRTTIDLPDSLFRAVKTRAVQEGTTLKDLMASYIEAGLCGQGARDISRRRRRPPLPVAIEREPGEPLTRALTNLELEALLEGEDVEGVARRPRNPPSDS
jgi:hypothetical protein